MACDVLPVAMFDLKVTINVRWETSMEKKPLCIFCLLKECRAQCGHNVIGFLSLHSPASKGGEMSQSQSGHKKVPEKSASLTSALPHAKYAHRTLKSLLTLGSNLISVKYFHLPTVWECNFPNLILNPPCHRAYTFLINKLNVCNFRISW